MNDHRKSAGPRGNKVALVTGAGRGIGAAIARHLATAGYSVAVTDIQDTDVAGVCQDIAVAGGQSLGIHLDVAKRGSVESALAEVKNAFGRVDFLVSNAAVDAPGLFLDSDEDQWNRMFQVNLIGAIRCSQVFAADMVATGGGAIVHVASDAGKVGSGYQAVYSATKGGLIAFTKSAARELARHSIRVNAVCPGPTRTPLLEQFTKENAKLSESLRKAIPMRRLGEPNDIPPAVEFLGSDGARFVTGQALSVSGGLTMSS